MKYLISFFGTILRLTFFSAILSLIFGAIQFLLSLFSLASTPTWSKMLYGGISLFLLGFCYSIFKVIQYSYFAWRDPVFKDAHIMTGISWSDYKRIKEEGEQNKRYHK